MEGTLAIGKAWILLRGNGAWEQSGRTLEEAFVHEAGRLKAYIKDSPAPEVFSAHLEILEDPLLLDTIKKNVEEGMAPSEAIKVLPDKDSRRASDTVDKNF